MAFTRKPGDPNWFHRKIPIKPYIKRKKKLIDEKAIRWIIKRAIQNARARENNKKNPETGVIPLPMSAIVANPYYRRRFRRNPYIGPSHQLAPIGGMPKRKKRSDAGKKRGKRRSISRLDAPIYSSISRLEPPIRRKRKRKAGKSMAKRRKTRSDKGKKRTKRRYSRRRRLPIGRVLKRRPRRGFRYGRSGRWRRGTKTIYINPRRRHRRRRNPGFGGGGVINSLKAAFVPYAVGFVTSLAASVIDTAMANTPATSSLIKIGGVVGIAAMFGRRNPRAAAAAIGALAAAQGYPLGIKLGGGFVAKTPGETVKGLGAMSRVHPEIGLLLQGGLGALLNGPNDVDTVSRNYSQALHNMADDD